MLSLWRHGAYATCHNVCCICLNTLRTCHSSLVIILVSCRVVASPSCLSIIHWCVSCFVPPCFAFPPPPASCLGWLYLRPFCFQLCLSLPLQESTLRSTFRSARRRNDRGSIAGIGWRREEVWFRARGLTLMKKCLFWHVERTHFCDRHFK